MAEWNDELARARAALEISAREAAERAGISEATFRRYENGTRRPRREVLQRVAKVLGFSDEAANRVLANAGLSTDPEGPAKSLERRRLPLPTDPSVLNAYPWPCLLSNEFYEVVAWNAPSTAVGELDLSTFERADQRHFLRLAAMEHFRERLMNWDELIGGLLEFWKGAFDDITATTESSSYFGALINDLNHDEPETFLRVLDLWTKAKPWNERRNTHPIEWTVSDGTALRFMGVFRTWSDFDAIFSFDWHPRDAATWRWLAEHAANPGAVSDPEVANGTPSDEQHWTRLLAAARVRARRTWRDVSEATGIRLNTLYSISNGRRLPTREDLLAIMAALELDAVNTNAILGQLSMTLEPSAFAKWVCGIPQPTWLGLARWSVMSTHDADPRDEVARCEWPVLLFDRECELVGFNAAAGWLTGMGREPDMADVSQPGSHLLRLVTHTRIRSRIENWEEVAVIMLPGSVKPFFNPATVSAPATVLERAIAELRKSDPAILRELSKLWAAPPGTPNSPRVTFSLRWRTDAGESLRFDGLISGWNQYDDYWVIDLHPGDATCEWLAAQPAE